MDHPRQPAPDASHTVNWALDWHADRREDRRGLQVALGFAILIHAALLVVRMVEDPEVLAPVDAVLRFQVRNVALKDPKPKPPEAVAPEAPREVVRVPVPPELAPPEPLRIAEVPSVPIELTLPSAPITAIPGPPPAPVEMPVRFTGEMTRPIRLAGLDPAYTEPARKAREQGVVILDAVIDKNGIVTEIEVLKELGFGLTEAAVRAVETWRFEPARLGGRLIAVRYSLTVRFALR